MRPNQAFESKWLKADSDDIPPTGSVTATIEQVVLELVKNDDGNDERKPVIYFKEFPKGMIINKTNWNMIADILGTEESDEWPGFEVQLYSADVQFGQKMTRGIRVLKPRPQRPGPRPQPAAAPSQARPDRTNPPARRPDPGAPAPGQGEADEENIPW